MARILSMLVLLLMVSCGNGRSSASYRVDGGSGSDDAGDVGSSDRPGTYSGERPYLPYQPRVNGGGGGVAMSRDNEDYRMIHNVGETFQTNTQH